MTILDSLVEGALCLGNRRESNELLGMMVRYLVTGEAPEPRTDAQRMAITMIMPVLENSRARAEAGRKGGQSKGASEAESKAASKPSSKRANKAESKRASKTESKPESKRASEEEEEEELGVWINPSDCENEGEGGAEFVPPTLEEVKTYFAVNCLRGSASKFFDYYESNGWTRQGFPIAKWEPVARIWSDRERGYDAERKARGGQTSQEVERAAVWKPAETEDDVIAALERELGESA